MAFINRDQVEHFQTCTPKVLQFGGGVFMRGYMDWMINGMNNRGDFNGSVILVKLTPGGNLQAYEDQGGVYQHIIRGIDKGDVVNETELVTCIQQWIHPYEQWQDYLATADHIDIVCVTSNSTEAGIRYQACPFPQDSCPDSFPAKLCAWLYARYQGGHAGVWVLPCELIEDNGDQLYEIVVKHAKDWELSEAFVSWLSRSNTFVNTLVDRIVSPPPAEELEQRYPDGAKPDQLLNASEPYHLLVLDCDESLESDLPLKTSGFNVVYTSDLNAYRERKVKLLNGAHTSMLFLSYLRGNNTVEESLNDDLIAGFLRDTLYQEIIPTIDMDRDELAAYAESVLERFRNPFLKHQLLSISLNSISKIQHRVLKTVADFVSSQGRLPERLLMSFASFLLFYRGAWNDGVYQGSRGDERYTIKDDEGLLRSISSWWDAGGDYGARLPELLQDRSLWGSDLNAIPGFSSQIAADLECLMIKGVDAALAACENSAS